MSKTSLTPRPATVSVKIDRALKEKWDTALHTIQGARHEGATAYDQLWEAVGAIVEHEPPLYLAGGFASAGAFFKQHLGETERSARRNIRVAKYASPNEEARYGTSKLDAALAYVEARTGDLKGRLPVDFGKLRVPSGSKRGPATVSLEEATVQQINAATRALTRAAGKSTAKAPPAVTAITKALSAAKLHGVTVRLANGKLSLGAIPVESLAALAKVLGSVKLG